MIQPENGKVTRFKRIGKNLDSVVLGVRKYAALRGLRRRRILLGDSGFW